MRVHVFCLRTLLLADSGGRPRCDREVEQSVQLRACSVGGAEREPRSRVLHRHCQHAPPASRPSGRYGAGHVRSGGARTARKQMR